MYLIHFSCIPVVLPRCSWACPMGNLCQIAISWKSQCQKQQSIVGEECPPISCRCTRCSCSCALSQKYRPLYQLAEQMVACWHFASAYYWSCAREPSLHLCWGGKEGANTRNAHAVTKPTLVASYGCVWCAPRLLLYIRQPLRPGVVKAVPHILGEF